MAASATAALLLAGCSAEPGEPRPSRSPRIGRHGVEWAPECEEKKLASICAEAEYLGNLMLDRLTGRPLGPARVSVSDGRVTYIVRRREPAPRDFIVGDYEAGFAPVGPGQPIDWRQLPTLRQGKTRTLRFVGRSDVAAYRASVALTALSVGPNDYLTEVVGRLVATVGPAPKG